MDRDCGCWSSCGAIQFFLPTVFEGKEDNKFEPLKNCFEVLKLNAAASSDCYNCAISAANKTVTMCVPAQSSQLSSYIRDEKERYINFFSVESKRLDDVLGELNITHCDLVKIDTEGSEYEVLLSARQVLDKTRFVLVEMSVNRASAGNIFTVGDFLQRQGFKLKKLLPYKENHSSADGIFEKKGG